MGYDVPTKGRPAMPESFAPYVGGDSSHSRPVEDKIIRAEERRTAKREAEWEREEELAALSDWVRARLLEEASRPGDPTSTYIMFRRVTHPTLDFTCDVAVYVGISRHMARRVGEHGSQKPWFPDVDFIVTEPWRNRRIAERRESYLIRALDPMHNKSYGRLKFGPKDRLGTAINELGRAGQGSVWPVDNKMPGLATGFYAMLPDRPSWHDTGANHFNVVRLPDHVHKMMGSVETHYV